MRHSDKMEIPPGESLTLAPGNRHIMLMQVKRVLAPGDIVPMTLQFESAPAQAVDFPVRALGDEGAS